MSEAQQESTGGGSLFQFLFVTRSSVAAISVVLLVLIGALPNLGVIVGWGFLLLALLLCVRRGSFAEIGFRRPASWSRTVVLGFGLGAIIQLMYCVVVDPLIERITGSAVERDGKIITSRGPGTAMDFALELIEALTDRANRDQVEAGLQRPASAA